MIRVRNNCGLASYVQVWEYGGYDSREAAPGENVPDVTSLLNDSFSFHARGYHPASGIHRITHSLSASADINVERLIVSTVARQLRFKLIKERNDALAVCRQ